MTDTRFRTAFLVLLVVAISAAFVAVVRPFLLTLLLAAIFTGVAYPLHRRLTAWLRGRARVSALFTLLLLLVLVVGPLLAVLGAVAAEAQRIQESVLPRLQRLIDEPGEIERRLRLLPGYDLVAPYREQILARAGELVGGAGRFVFDALSATTRATVMFIVHFVILLYTMYFFLLDGPRMVRAALRYLPLDEADKARMLEKFVSVTRATLKGTILIGAAQGTLGGLAFFAVGIEAAFFWGTVMTVLSIVPGVGAALVWVPAAIVLAAVGQIWQGVALALFCGLVVGSLDNLLRPVLVGRDTELHELMIFFSTIGGLLLFGAPGFLLGPILAALFVTVWEMFGVAFRRELGGS